MFASAASNAAIEPGALAGAGTFRCTKCDYTLSLDAMEPLPACPSCGAGTSFARASIFDHPTGEAPAIDLDAGEPEWLDEARAGLEAPGRFVALEDGENRVSVIALDDGWSRIGRSAAADLRIDDPTVSRRHALIVCEPGGVRILDDRSLNGVFVNGARADWSGLEDGDEIAIGRYRLFFIDTLTAPAREAA